jgi:glycine cleavage system T protein (aminomethyltransferase)
MSLRTTPFVEHHRAQGAKLVPFAGFLMPLQYEGIVAEHKAVRNAVGLFDVSHMGEFEITGPGAVAFADKLLTNQVAGAEPGQAVYSPLCLPDGGIVDDLLAYRYADKITLVVNAANIAADWAHVSALAPADVRRANCSEQVAQLALQGPRAVEVMSGLVPSSVLELSYYRFQEVALWGTTAVISRTGYTGEDGFELYFPCEYADEFWDGLMRAGAKAGIKPCGLGARDSLRLEMGFCLYGNDIDRTTNPLEAGLGWTVKLDKPDFVGKSALERVKAEGLKRKLAGFLVEGPRVPRHGMDVVDGGTTVGTVTSGGFSPCMERGIGMGYVPPALAKNGARFGVKSGNADLVATTTARPFYEGAFHSKPKKAQASG